RWGERSLSHLGNHRPGAMSGIFACASAPRNRRVCRTCRAQARLSLPTETVGVLVHRYFVNCRAASLSSFTCGCADAESAVGAAAITRVGGKNGPSAALERIIPTAQCTGGETRRSQASTGRKAGGGSRTREKNHRAAKARTRERQSKYAGAGSRKAQRQRARTVGGRPGSTKRSTEGRRQSANQFAARKWPGRRQAEPRRRR